MAEKVAGTVSLNVDGEIIKVKGSTSHSMVSFERESIIGLDSVHGFSEKPVAPFIEVTATTTSNLDVGKLADNTNGTITLLTANKKCVLSGAYITTQPSSNAENGEVTLRWEGVSGSEKNR